MISCSWGSDDGPDKNFYDTYILHFKLLGIFVAFANGNSGPNCRTTGYPASNQLVFSVGASNINNIVSSFSSRGPTLNDGDMAPKACAPGENITSCDNNPAVNPGFKTMSGTSMATPHVAGAACLLRASCPDASPDDIESALMDSAITDVGNPGVCNPKGNECGEGCIDVVQARKLLANRGCPIPK